MAFWILLLEFKSTKGFQMGNKLRLKIRIFDLEGLRDFESKKLLKQKL